ncbi:hypothetical protein NECID01_1722 [Nematocida sp. AWRm77]|nr:hypothetical protein NECID01_1722 [Nematocida sp. AWRm77]
MDLGGDSELYALTKKFADSIELGNIHTEEGRKKKFVPFKTKYESAANTEKIQTVEQELSRLKDLQSKVLSMQDTIGDTIHREVKRTREKEIKDIRVRYRQKLREMEGVFEKKAKEAKRAYEEKLERVVAKIKERAEEAIAQKIESEVERIKKEANKKVLEIKLRNKAVIDKLSQMYISLKEKYKKDVQGLSS